MRPLVTDSITSLPPGAAGQPIVCASHGGLYSACCALEADVSAAIFSDAGIGKERAGVAGLDLLDSSGVAAVAVSHRSARIGDGADCFRRGVVSTVNRAAQAVGAAPGMSTEAVWRLFAERCGRASHLGDTLPRIAEARHAVPGFGAMPVVAMDSNSLVTEADRNAVVVTGSHGGLLGGDPQSAIKLDVFAAIYNDADVGIDEAGIGRLAPLNARGIAAVTVSAWSARIGDGRSTVTDGVLSHANALATRFGALRGQTVRHWLSLLSEAWATRQSDFSLPQRHHQ